MFKTSHPLMPLTLRGAKSHLSSFQGLGISLLHARHLANFRLHLPVQKK
jgi:hypothetical protein